MLTLSKVSLFVRFIDFFISSTEACSALAFCLAASAGLFSAFAASVFEGLEVLDFDFAVFSVLSLGASALSLAISAGLASAFAAVSALSLTVSAGFASAFAAVSAFSLAALAFWLILFLLCCFLPRRF